jgi:hypothetical protein
VATLDMSSPESRDVRDSLVAASLVMGESFPELDEWHDDAVANTCGWGAQLPRTRLSKSFRGVFLDDPTVAYRIKVSLQGVDPPIWRRLEIPDCSLCELHEIIQVAMGWEDYHLHAFTIGDDTYGDPDLREDDSGFVSGRMVYLSDLFTSAGQRFHYEYDFGDGWPHEILIEEIVGADEGTAHPRCLVGKRACPPEDVGGIPGYMDYLEALSDPDHEEHDACLQWRGEFDSEAFDLEVINRRLASFATRDDDDDVPAVPLIEVGPSLLSADSEGDAADRNTGEQMSRA